MRSYVIFICIPMMRETISTTFEFHDAADLERLVICLESHSKQD